MNDNVIEINEEKVRYQNQGHNSIHMQKHNFHYYAFIGGCKTALRMIVLINFCLSFQFIFIDLF